MTSSSQRPAPALPEKILRKLLRAQEKENFKNFTSMLTTVLKEKCKKSVFFKAGERFSKHLAGGYELEFLMGLKQTKRSLYVWKLIFSDQSGEALVQLWVTPKEEVAGILLHPGRRL
jgi:hypothetical protein